jgi:hypothetical protein
VNEALLGSAKIDPFVSSEVEILKARCLDFAGHEWERGFV